MVAPLRTWLNHCSLYSLDPPWPWSTLTLPRGSLTTQLTSDGVVEQPFTVRSHRLCAVPGVVEAAHSVGLGALR